ncbi:MAG TPA: class I SAM-dependent methyltransferase [Candidatus Binatia bacterium]|nr:class I SAM-dependent methyltransferase [Candidatus Binatia bacterium]
MTGLAGDAVEAVTEYYRRAREELQDLLPPRPRRVLDVGCGEGALGAAVKRAHPCCEVLGVELSPEAAAVARARLDRVLVGDVERVDVAVDAALDAIVYGDVLEHCVDPWAVLRRHAALLADGGRVVVSLPNVRHWAVILGLLRGAWEYQEAGILDRGHLRFFTRREGERLLAQAGLRVRGVRPVYWQPVPDVPPGATTVSVTLEEFRIAGIPAADFAELFAGQLVYVGERGPVTPPWEPPGARGFHVLAWPAWGSAALHALLEAYCTAFRPGDDVALVLCADSAGAAPVDEALRALGRSRAAAPDVVVAPADATLRHRVLRAAHAFVRLGAPGEPDAEAAWRSGVVAVAPEASALRAAWARARGVTLPGEPLRGPGLVPEVGP